MPVASMDFDIPFEIDAAEELFLIGDVHGHSDLMDTLLDEVAATPRVDDRTRTLVFLGDLIDRGPDSLGCLDRAIGAKDRTSSDRVIGLFGNHEQMLMTALANNGSERGDIAAHLWLMNGGTQVLEELPADIPGQDTDLVSALGKSRIQWLSGLRSHYASGSVLAVHAGLNPAVEVDEFLSTPWDVHFVRFDESAHWAWIRRPFLMHVPAENSGHGGYFVIHGHTPPAYEASGVSEQIRRCRLNLDGGSFGTGKARMARVVGRRVTFCETE